MDGDVRVHSKMWLVSTVSLVVTGAVIIVLFALSASTPGRPAARAAAAASSARWPAAISSPRYISVWAWVDSARACSRLGGSPGSMPTAVAAASSASAGSSISSR